MQRATAEPSPTSPDFSRRLADLMNATGVRPARIERVLRGQAAAVRRTTIYNWLNGSSLPLSIESLLAVIHACVNHAEVKISPAALRSDHEWETLLGQAKQERDSRAGRSARRVRAARVSPAPARSLGCRCRPTGKRSTRPRPLTGWPGWTGATLIAPSPRYTRWSPASLSRS